MTTEVISKNIVVNVDVKLHLENEDELKAFKNLLDDAEKGMLIRVQQSDKMFTLESNIINALRKHVTN